MNKNTNIHLFEFLLIGVLWLGIFSIPFFTQRANNYFEWSTLLMDWMRIFFFFAVFVVNTTLLVPRFLLTKKYSMYIASSIVMIFIFAGLGIFLKVILFPPPEAMPPMNLGPGTPPIELSPGMPAPMGYRPESQPVKESLFMALSANVVISFLIVGSSTALKVISQWLFEENRRKDVEKEQLKTELALLRHQVSPHFFMNTLNNIHALIDINTEDAKDTVIRLSTMMRYLLYDTAHGRTSLRKEINFIESYVSLMRLRFSSKVVVTVDVPKQIQDIQIPPMLFISFLENAFKHGVSYQHESFVLFKLDIVDQRLNCTIKNSKHATKELSDSSYSGIGLTNVKKSLELLFEKDYTLEIVDNENDFTVNLSVPYHEN